MEAILSTEGCWQTYNECLQKDAYKLIMNVYRRRWQTYNECLQKDADKLITNVYRSLKMSPLYTQWTKWGSLTQSKLNGVP